MLRAPAGPCKRRGEDAGRAHAGRRREAAACGSYSRPVLEGAFNFRDLGGLRLADGRALIARRLFRSDTLQALTPRDVTLLLDELGVCTVVDLRLASEVQAEGRGPLGESGRVRFVDSPFEMASADGVPPEQVLERLYERCLASDSLPLAVQSIAAHADRPLVFHCAAGKDRTGIVAAVVLGLIGVPDDAIVADYLRSAAAMPRMIERFNTWPRYREHLAAMPREVYAVEERPIRRLLAGVRDRFGGLREWAAHSGIAPSTVQRLQTLLVAPS